MFESRSDPFYEKNCKNNLYGCYILGSGESGFRSIADPLFNRYEKQKNSLETQYPGKNNNDPLYNVIFNESSDGILIIQDGVIIDCNQKTVDLLKGKDKSDILGKKPWDISPQYQPDGRESVIKAHEVIDKVLNGEESRFYWQHLRFDGSLVHLYISLFKIEYQEKVYVAASFRDISESMDTRQKLKDSESKYKELFEQSGDGCFIMDREVIIDCNSKMLSLYGMKSKENLIGKTVLDISPKYQYDGELSKSKAVKYIERALSGEKLNFEWLHHHTSGKLIDVEVALSKVDVGTHHYMMSTNRDISQRKKAERQLLESEERLKRLLEESFDGIFIHRNYKIVYMNDQFRTMIGSSGDDLMGKNPLDLLTSESRQKVTDENMKEENLFNDLKLINQKNGELINVNSVRANCHYNGEEAKIIAVKDITEKLKIDREKKLLEEMLIQNEKMLSIGGLAAGMAHEINNPLAGIVQTANVMSNRLIKKTDSPASLKIAEKLGITVKDIQEFMKNRDIDKMVNMINESAQRVSVTVNNMLSFARKDSGSKTIENINELLDSVLLISQTDYDFKKNHDFNSIEIVKEYDSDLPEIPCEKTKIQQVFLNLFRNGAQAMHEAEIKKPKFTIRVYKDKANMIIIEIEDNGPGMSEEISKKIFEPFFTTKPEGVGTGLGLSVSYFIIVKNHKGTMKVESTEGSGTKFTIGLPQ